MYLQEEDRVLVDDFVERCGGTPLLLKTRERVDKEEDGYMLS